jgi:hypothetical protein
MEGYKIKINKASEDSYWYSDYIGSEFWSYVDKQNGGFTIVPEGTYCKDTLLSTRKNHWDKHVTEEDCEVLNVTDVVALHLLGEAADGHVLDHAAAKRADGRGACCGLAHWKGPCL